jgi:hypothetical protein
LQELAKATFFFVGTQSRAAIDWGRDEHLKVRDDLMNACRWKQSRIQSCRGKFRRAVCGMRSKPIRAKDTLCRPFKPSDLARASPESRSQSGKWCESRGRHRWLSKAAVSSMWSATTPYCPDVPLNASSDELDERLISSRMVKGGITTE